MAVSITQQTEAGTVYEPDEIRAIAAAARERDCAVHMDGARFANAIVQLGVSPSEITWKAGVDILSFGGTKNGCLGAEAIVFFDRSLAEQAPYLRKRAGQLFSKLRFIAAQFERYLDGGLWLDLAAHANRRADELRAALRGHAHAREAWPTHGNEVFAILSRNDAAALRAGSVNFYEWHAPPELPLAPHEVLLRLVTSFATEESETAAFSAILNG